MKEIDLDLFHMNFKPVTGIIIIIITVMIHFASHCIIQIIYRNKVKKGKSLHNPERSVNISQQRT